MKKHARQMCFRANARRKKHTECITEYSCDVLGLVAFESCMRRDVLRGLDLDLYDETHA